MRYSKTITDYCNSYRITPQDVFFAILRAHGCTQAESYAAVFQCDKLKESTVKSRASNLMTEKPGLAKLVADLIQQKTTAPVNPPSWADYPAMQGRGEARYKGSKKKEETAGGLSGWNEEESTAENVERIIKEELPRMTGKEKLDATFKFAKLRGVDPEISNTTHYYLPLSCRQCSLYKAHKEVTRGQEEAEK